MVLENKPRKILRIISLIVSAVALTLAIPATVLMFLDEYSYYNWFYGTRYIHSNPEAGIMPACATVLGILALVMVLVQKKKPGASWATMALSFLSMCLFYASAAMIEGIDAWIGYYLASVAASLLLGVSAMSLVYALLKGKGKQTQAAAATEKSPVKQTVQNVDRTKTKKILWIVSLCTLGVALVLSLAGSILLFDDYFGLFEESGIMAVVGLVLIAGALTMCILQRKFPKLAFGTMSAAFAAACLSTTSILATPYYEVLIPDGWYLALVAGLLAMGVAVIALLSVLLKDKTVSAAAPAGSNKVSATASTGMRIVKLILWIVMICTIGIAICLAIPATVLLFLEDWDVAAGILGAVGTFCLVAALVMGLIQRKHPKLGFGTMGAAISAGPLLISTIGAIYWWRAEDYAYIAVAAGVLAITAGVIALVHALLKGGKQPRVYVNGEPDWIRNKNYHANIAHAREAFEDLKVFYEKGLLTKEEYREERIYVMYSYEIGKDARLSDTFREYEAKRWKAKKQDASEAKAQHASAVASAPAPAPAPAPVPAPAPAPVPAPAEDPTPVDFVSVEEAQKEE